jgi:hypothetical protein
MTNVKVTCACGAIYEVIETKGPSRDPAPFTCVLCQKELFAWEGNNVGQLRLGWRFSRAFPGVPRTFSTIERNR